jgi:hypothetical protein
MDLKDLIQKMDNIESTQELNESVVNEMGYPENPGAPVSMNISLNASGKEHVADLIDMMKNAGIGEVEGDSEASGPMRGDMEKFRSMIDEPHDGKGHEHFGTDKDIDDPEEPGKDEVPGDDDSEEGFLGTVAGGVAGGMLGGPLGALTGAAAGDSLTDDEATEGWDNEPDEEYRDHKYMTKDLSGGINREKPKGAIRAKDPAIHQTVETTSVKEQLWAALNEKMAAEGRGRGKKKKVMASRGRGKTEDIKEMDCPECGKPGKKKLMACASCGCK